MKKHKKEIIVTKLNISRNIKLTGLRYFTGVVSRAGNVVDFLMRAQVSQDRAHVAVQERVIVVPKQIPVRHLRTSGEAQSMQHTHHVVQVAAIRLKAAPT